MLTIDRESPEVIRRRIAKALQNTTIKAIDGDVIAWAQRRILALDEVVEDDALPVMYELLEALGMSYAEDGPDGSP